jgi:hypothetical protein
MGSRSDEWEDIDGGKKEMGFSLMCPGLYTFNQG